MSNQQILERAIQKAIDGGWDRHYRGTYLWSVRELAQYVEDRGEVSLLIFNHGFAKALWGESIMVVDNGCAYEETGDRTDYSKYWQLHFLNSWNYDIPLWSYHLSKMVIAADPIKYLGENL
jgi:hypothetical protein